MASSKGYLEYVLERLSGLEGITYRPMMGEYILYYSGKVIGGIYDDRFLVKPAKKATSLIPDAKKVKPYEGAKDMLLVENIDDDEFLRGLVKAVAEELPAPNKKRF
ncbi:MAG: TfoX/Sxy family protein [Clostridia bacterium]|nr:TfoX/Sxy family protein [Clostridia bacterium]